MTRPHGAARLILLLSLFINVSHTPGALRADTDPRLQRVFADWRKRQDALRSIRYLINADHVILKGSFVDNMGRPLDPPSPARDISCPANWMFLFDFASQRYRMEISAQLYSSRARQFYSEVSQTVFNGSDVRLAFPKEDNDNPVSQPNPKDPDLCIISGNLRGFSFEPQYLPVFFGHGIVPTVESPIVSGQFWTKLDPSYFHIHGSGVHRGRPCLVMRTETLQLTTSRYDELWVDPSKDSAIVRYVIYTTATDTKPFFDIDIQYESTANGWLAKKWTFTTYLEGKVHSTDRISVREVQLEPWFTDSDFELETKPGMLIMEKHFPESSNRLFLPSSQDKIYHAGARGWVSDLTAGWNSGQIRLWTLAALAGALAIVLWVLRKRWMRHA